MRFFRHVTAMLALASACTASASAAAQEADDEAPGGFRAPPVAPEPDRVQRTAALGRGWYGWQTLIIFGLSDAMLIGAGATFRSHDATLPMVLGAAGIAGHVFGPPLVHLNNGGHNLGPSLLASTAIPLAVGGTTVALVGSSTGGRSCTGRCGTPTSPWLPALGIGAMVSTLALVPGNLVDVLSLSTPRHAEPATAKRVSFVPVVDPGHAGVVAAGVF